MLQEDLDGENDTILRKIDTAENKMGPVAELVNTQ